MTSRGFSSALLFLLCAHAVASETPEVRALPDTPTPSPAAAQAPGRVLKANTVVEVQLEEGVSSRTNKSGDQFRLRLIRPVLVDAQEVIPVDTPVIGEVIHAAKSGFGGKAGELIVAARYIDTPSGRIKLRSSFGASGVDSVQESITLAVIAGAVGFVIKGSEKELPTGTQLSARVAVDTVLSTGQ